MHMKNSMNNKKTTLKKIIKIGLIICGILIFMALIFFKIEEISDVIIRFKAKLFATNWKNTQVDFSRYEPMQDDPDAWYSTSELVLHACGGIEGKTYTNSKSALEENLKKGHRVVEIDLAVTSDGEVVGKHNWAGQTPTYKEFMSTPIEYLYEPLDASQILDYMTQYPDLYIVTDIKGDREYIGSVFEKIVELAGKKDCTDVLDRFVVQIYYKKDYDYIKNIYPFTNWIYTLYESADRDLNAIAEFCLTHDIPVVTMPNGWVQDAEYISVFNEMNIKVYVNTLNSLDLMKTYRDRGVYGFYTDYIKPQDLSVVGLQ